MDFTINTYKSLLALLLECSYNFISLKEVSNNRDKARCVLLRHDVDCLPSISLKFAEIDAEFGIPATFFFRTVSHVFKPKIIKRITELGHDIGYHYEDLSRANGDYKKAIELFNYNLRQLRQFVDVKTIAMHGVSYSHYNNQDLWKKYSYRDFGVIMDAYDESAFKDFCYLTDTGGTWMYTKYNIQDHIPNTKKYAFKSDDDIFDFIKQRKHNFYFQIHTDNWAINSIDKIRVYGVEFLIRRYKDYRKLIRKL